jgi:hypothetical protein
MKPLLSMVDHIVYVTPDIERSVLDLGARLGVAAIPGGQHPSWGTRNALLALGPLAYLEIMGADPSLPQPPMPRPLGIDGLSVPRLATWVCRSEDLNATVSAARRAGVDLGNVESRSRTRPDGTLLRWSMSDLFADRLGGIVPFFINWGGSPHPAQSAPMGCTLEGLRAEHPEPERVRVVLKALGIDLPVSYGKEVLLVADLRTARGRVQLS